MKSSLMDFSDIDIPKTPTILPLYMDKSGTLPKVGDKVFLKSLVWSSRGRSKTKFRKGKVKKIIPAENGSGHYNIFLGGLFGGRWYSVDGKNTILAYNGYPVWGKESNPNNF